jgi:hypothetical protein
MSLIIKYRNLSNTCPAKIVILREDVVSVPSVTMATYKTGLAETTVRDWNNKFCIKMSQDS